MISNTVAIKAQELYSDIKHKETILGFRKDEANKYMRHYLNETLQFSHLTTFEKVERGEEES